MAVAGGGGPLVEFFPIFKRKKAHLAATVAWEGPLRISVPKLRNERFYLLLLPIDGCGNEFSGKNGFS